MRLQFQPPCSEIFSITRVQTVGRVPGHVVIHWRDVDRHRNGLVVERVDHRDVQRGIVTRRSQAPGAYSQRNDA